MFSKKKKLNFCLSAWKTSLTYFHLKLVVTTPYSLLTCLTLLNTLTFYYNHDNKQAKDKLQFSFEYEYHAQKG